MFKTIITVIIVIVSTPSVRRILCYPVVPENLEAPKISCEIK